MGWGSFEQKKTKEDFTAKIDCRYGYVQIARLGLETGNPTSVTAMLNNKKLSCTLQKNGTVTIIQFNTPVTIAAQQQLSIQLS